MKKIFILITALFAVGLSPAQSLNLSTNENYVYSKTYLSDPSLPNPKSVETVQYIDGLGRPKQIVDIKASPSGKDVVTPIEYDPFGRQVKDYLPVPQSGTLNGAIVPSPLAHAVQPDLYGSEKIYAEKILENSPLDRIQQQIQVGTDWNNKPVQFDYDANIAGEVIKYTTVTVWENKATKSGIHYSGTYGAAQLYKNTVTDEDGNTTIEFKNGRGQILLLRKVLSATENADTYYVYNEYDQLAWVIPPLLSKMQTWGMAEQNALAYEYRYDGRNRLVEKKLPGKGWEYRVYDKADRLIMSQDANLRPDKRWLFTKYDQFSRVIYTGITADPNGREGIQAYVDYNFTNNYEKSGSFTQNGLTVEYTGLNAFPTSMDQLLSVNYYDTYPSETPAVPTQVLGQNVLTQDAQNAGVSTKSLPTASYVKNIEDDSWTKNYFWYDTRGRAIGSYSINHLGGYTKTESELDFAGTPKQVVTRHKRLRTDPERVITETFTYDHQNRLLVHTHQVDNQPVEYLAQNEYNELSQLKTKKVGGTNGSAPLQTVDYQYNIRGWLTKINDPANLGSDLFGYKIKYNQVEGLETPDALDGTLKVLPRFNGNIAEVDWKTATHPNDYLRRYGYVYDHLNRLLAGFYQKDSNPSLRENYEKVTYDLNGNIRTLERTAAVNSWMAVTTDHLIYQYQSGGKSNVLESIQDVSENNTGYPFFPVRKNISYDQNGNMTNHPDKEISSIRYNLLNLPYEILRSAEPYSNTYQLNYTYRADGKKVGKRHKLLQMDGAGNWSPVELVTDYLDGFQYAQNIQSGSVQPLQLQFVPTSEGYFDFVKNKYIYHYTDHLGNVRVSYLHNGSSIEVLEENNYYPFGLKHEGYNPLAGNPSYQYKYNGKELQETGMYDYGARFYMPDIGRWGVIDPRSQYTHETYSYVWNNPISFWDPTGMEGEDPDPKKVYGPKGGKPIEEVKIIPIYRSVKLEPRGIDYSTTGILSGIAMTGGRAPNPYALAAAGIAAIILWNTPKIYQATQAWKKDEMVIDLSPKALPANFAQGQDEADEDTDVNGVDVPEEGKLEKSPTGKGSVPPSERDPKRVPGAKEKKAQWTENNKECANCEKEMSLEDTRSHHYPKRWSDGGRKTVPVCKTCHKQLHKK